jgi:hypothetical protein
MMPDGDTAAHLRKQVGGLFLCAWHSRETDRCGFRFDPKPTCVAVASCLVRREERISSGYARGPLSTQLGHESRHQRRRFGLANAKTVIGCRATPFDTMETCALRQPSSIGQCRRADDHQVFREVACAGAVVPKPVLFRPAMQAGFSKTPSGSETRMELMQDWNLR